MSAAEHATAVAISGTADPNAAISLSINGNTYATTTDANGNWTVDVPTGKLPTGEVDVPMTVTATDPAGNETTANGTLHVDTVGSVDISEELVENDGVVSKAELDDGLVPITGTSEAGTTSVLVRFLVKPIAPQLPQMATGRSMFRRQNCQQEKQRLASRRWPRMRLVTPAQAAAQSTLIPLSTNSP